jgi:hypothetical protein
MSTNAVIRVQGLPDVDVYKHFDGCPSSTLPWLEKFNEDFTKIRGDDPSYKFAQLLRSSAFDCEAFNLDQSKSTGWGVFNHNLHEYDYLYILNTDGSVTVEEA